MGGILPLIRKNEVFLIKQLDFMQEQMEEAFLLKDVQQLRKIERIENPFNRSDIRKNGFGMFVFFLNKYGLNFVDELCELLYDFDGNHKIVKL